MRFAGWEEGANPDFPCDRRRLSWLPTPADGVLSTVSLQPTQYSWLPAPTDVVLSTVFIMADGLPLASYTYRRNAEYSFIVADGMFMVLYPY